MVDCLDYHTVTVPYDPKVIDDQIRKNNKYCVLGENEKEKDKDAPSPTES